MGGLIFKAYFISVIFNLAVVFGAYWFVIKLVLPFIKNDKWHDRVKFYVPLLRNLMIFLLILDILLDLGKVFPFLTIGVVTGLVIIFWNYVKEFCQGTVFKFQRGNIVGQRLKVREFAGQIMALNNTKLEIETEKGEVVQIPYSQIISDVEIKPTSAKYLRACVLVFSVAEEEFDNFEKKIFKFISSIPYVVDSVKPKMEIVNQTSESLECKLVVYTNDEKFIPKIKSRILNFSKK